MLSHESSQERTPLLGRPSEFKDGPFNFKPKQLCELLDPKNPELLVKYGGAEKILEGLKVDPTTGLSSDEGLCTSNQNSKPFQERRKVFGKNVIPGVIQRYLLILVWKLFRDETWITLSIAALTSLVIDLNINVGWVEGTSIIAMIVLTNAINVYRAEEVSRKLDESSTYNVLRSGKEQQINVNEINVGDILYLEPDNIVPVDCIFLDGHNLTCDESHVTGESDLIKKGHVKDGMDPFILSGTKVFDGTGTCVVIAVGIYSFFGKTMMAILSYYNETSLLTKLLNALYEKFTQLDDTTTALAFAFASIQMSKDNFLVKVLSACKTMGDITVLCLDKTVLTQSKMLVTEGIIGQKKFDQTNDWKCKVATSTYNILIQGIAINSSAFKNKENGNINFVGNKTDCALLDFITSAGVDHQEIRTSTKFVKVYPFKPKRKTMTTFIKLSCNGPCEEATVNSENYRVHVKGAHEMILKACTHYVDAEDKVQQLDSSVKQSIETNAKNFASETIRTICFAYRDLTTSEFKQLGDTPELLPDNLIYLGLVCIQELLQPGVKESVEILRNAGVIVKMITGDNQKTANAIARETGILTRSGSSMNGSEFNEKFNWQLHETVSELQVLACSSPTDKDHIVKLLKENGETVAFIGNYGPALESADIGLSMITDPETAKEAASIILKDDDFNSIVKVLKWGRAVKANVRKFLQFQLTISITTIILSFITTVVNKSFLTAVQLFFIKFIMGPLSALALTIELPSDELLDRKSVSKKRRLVSFKMWKMIFGQAIFQIGIVLSLLIMGPTIFNLSNSKEDKEILNTLVFNTIVFLQIFNIINCRNTNDNLNVFENIFKSSNYIFIMIQIILITGQFFIIEHGNKTFGTTNLKWYQWLITILIGFLSLLVGFIIRFNTCVPESIFDEDYRAMITPTLRGRRKRKKFHEFLRRSRKIY
ncbi:hypothetical protein RclHR1_10280002 [Rhizophagus clarus]|uniref:Cation-transporting P-type ATPase N-terminal domain-containing protein n=1 Tax=Rhizophagus clarus TaxID=94130 RepID=A0A2Z6Q1E6_9GLOM|nr:hypothetical protein RclHR1_10280002 [Rhizophagus clarus]